MSDTSQPQMNAELMSEDDFEALEAVLSSDIVPEDCMDLEMLDGFLAGVLLSPRPIAVERWLPEVWSAHGDALELSGGREMQHAIRLVKLYYNELLATLGLDDEDECWEPFCFAVGEEDQGVELGDAWIDGFAQGLDLWPQGWEEGLDEEAVDAVKDTLDEVLSPWSEEADVAAEEAGAAAGEQARLQQLTAVGEAVNDIYAHWRDLELPPPPALDTTAAPGPAAAGPGRNDPCPCGSGKKYKKCCGALNGGEAAAAAGEAETEGGEA